MLTNDIKKGMKIKTDQLGMVVNLAFTNLRIEDCSSLFKTFEYVFMSIIYNISLSNTCKAAAPTVANNTQ